VVRRLLERLQQRVERRRRQHVDFVDDVDLVGAARRGIAGVVAQVAHLVDAVVGGAVDLDHVDEPSLGYLAAIVAGVARLAVLRREAVEPLGQQPSDRRLADAADTGEAIRVRHAALLQRIAECSHDGGLPYYLVESLRPPGTRKDLVGSIDHKKIRQDTTI